MARGERIAVRRLLAGSTVCYLHLGIDMGDGTVVHACPDDFRQPFGGGRVVRTSRAAFAAGDLPRVVDDPPAAFPPAEVAARAEMLVGRPGYCPVTANCEHLVTWCATGRGTSRQVAIVAGRVGAAARRVAWLAAGRLSAGAAGRLVVRGAARSSVRLGLATLLPTALVAEGAALAAEWRAHQSGRSAAASRRAGEAAGRAVSALAGALAGVFAGPAGILAGAVAGAAAWSLGSCVTDRVPHTDPS